MLSLAISNGKLYSGSYDYTIRVWDLNTLSRIQMLEGHSDAVRALAVAGEAGGGGAASGAVRQRLCAWGVGAQTLQRARQQFAFKK